MPLKRNVAGAVHVNVAVVVGAHNAVVVAVVVVAVAVVAARALMYVPRKVLAVAEVPLERVLNPRQPEQHIKETGLLKNVDVSLTSSKMFA